MQLIGQGLEVTDDSKERRSGDIKEGSGEYVQSRDNCTFFGNSASRSLRAGVSHKSGGENGTEDLVGNNEVPRRQNDAEDGAKPAGRLRRGRIEDI